MWVGLKCFCHRSGFLGFHYSEMRWKPHHIKFHFKREQAIAEIKLHVTVCLNIQPWKLLIVFEALGNETHLGLGIYKCFAFNETGGREAKLLLKP